MSPASFPSSSEDNFIHGLDYPPDFLSSLPVLLPRPAPHTPIRALSASQFASIHHAASVSHAPDHVLFPFFHGLEGENDQQKAFFSVTPDTTVIPPRFRGLIWVACEDDDTPSSDDGNDSDVVASDDSDDEQGSDGEDVGHSFGLDMDMDIDTELDLNPIHKQGSLSSSLTPTPNLTCDTSDLDSAPHMHPVHCRAPRIYTNTAMARDRSASVSSSSSSSSESLHAPSPCTPATSLDSPTPSCMPLGPPSPEPRPRIAPLIAAGFKLRDLLHFNAEGNAEFNPLRVPDGISLRNFDIQMVRVPISSCPCPHAIHLGFFQSLSCLIHHRVLYGRLRYPEPSGDHCGEVSVCCFRPIVDMHLRDGEPNLGVYLFHAPFPHLSVRNAPSNP
jgi:dual specificity MAP kinase phosphatase